MIKVGSAVKNSWVNFLYEQVSLQTFTTLVQMIKNKRPSTAHQLRCLRWKSAMGFFRLEDFALPRYFWVEIIVWRESCWHLLLRLLLKLILTEFWRTRKPTRIEREGMEYERQGWKQAPPSMGTQWIREYVLYVYINNKYGLTRKG